MRVYLVRHAAARSGSPDDLRPLTPEGHEQARALGRRLAEEGVRPSAVLSSPLLRARETAAGLARELAAPVVTDERLAPGATADKLRAAAGRLESPVVAVGHQPDCGEIAAEVTGREHAFPTAGLCVLDL